MMSDYEQYPIFDTNPSQQSLHGRSAHGQMSPPTAYPYMFQQNLQHHQQLHSPPGSQISHISPIANTAFSLDPSQLRSSEVGPSRVTTRRQARMANRQASASHAFASQHETQMGIQSGQNEGVNIFGVEQHSISRPVSPNSFQQQRFNAGPLSVDLGTILPNSAANTSMSPTHPGTPVSATSSAGFTHYGFESHGSASMHSRSGSNVTYPRSASPAMSSISVSTSISSEKDNMRPPISRGSNTSAPSSATSSAASAPSAPERPVRTKRRLSNYDRKDICEYACAHPNARQEDIAKKWDVERSTVSKILKNRFMYLNLSPALDNFNSRYRIAKFPRLEFRLEGWLEKLRAQGNINISDAMLRSKAKEIAKDLKLGEDKFKASAGWVENFKHRNNIVKGILKPYLTPPYGKPDDPWAQSFGEPARVTRIISTKPRCIELSDRHAEAEVLPIPEEIRATANIVNVNLDEPHMLPDGFAKTKLSEHLNLAHLENPGEMPTHLYALPSDSPEMTQFINQCHLDHLKLLEVNGRQVTGSDIVPPVRLYKSPDPMPNEPHVTAQEASKAFDIAFRYIRQHKLASVTQPIMGVLYDIRQELMAERHQEEKAIVNNAVSETLVQQQQPPMEAIKSESTPVNADEHMPNQIQTA